MFDLLLNYENKIKFYLNDDFQIEYQFNIY